jgi:DNA/RNA endonuclease G (NUC1)
MDDFEKEMELKKLEFEREKFTREVELKEKEFEFKMGGDKKSFFKNPLYITIFVAIIGLTGNAIVAYVNNNSQLSIEKRKAEAARILEVIKTGDPDKAATNLEFLLETGLVTLDTLKIRQYLDNRKKGEGASLAVADEYKQWDITKENISSSVTNCADINSIGWPSNFTKNFCRKGYSFGFAVKKKMCLWAMYTVILNRPIPKIPRGIDKWQSDPEIAQEHQVNEKFFAQNEYDKGHLIRRTDAMWSDTAVNEIFLYSVCVPMLDVVNRKYWYELENLTSPSKIETNRPEQKLIIISGPIYSSKTIRNYRGIADIPDSFYRIIFNPLLKKASAWIIPNAKINGVFNLSDYLVSVDKIENLTGLDFFNMYSLSEQESIEKMPYPFKF